MEQLITLEELSKILGVKKATLYAWVSKKKIPFIKLSARLVRFRESEIQDWLSQKSSSPVLWNQPCKKPKKSYGNVVPFRSSVDRMVKTAKEEVLRAVI